MKVWLTGKCKIGTDLRDRPVCKAEQGLRLVDLALCDKGTDLVTGLLFELHVQTGP